MTNQPHNTQVDDEFPAYGKPWPIQCDKCDILKNKPNFPQDALPTQHYMYHVPSKWSESDNTQELDGLRDKLYETAVTAGADSETGERAYTFVENELLDVLLDWHNKQVLEIIGEDEPEDIDDYPFEYGKQYGRNELRNELRTKLAKWLNQPTVNQSASVSRSDEGGESTKGEEE